MTRIDARNCISSLAMLEIGMHLEKSAPGEILEILCDDASLLEDIERIHPDCECSRMERQSKTGWLLALRKPQQTKEP